MPYAAQVAVGRLEALKVFGSDYPTPDGTGMKLKLLSGREQAANAQN